MTGLSPVVHQPPRPPRAAPTPHRAAPTPHRAAGFFIAASAFWFVVGGVAGLLLPALQLLPADLHRVAVYGQALTVHGLAITFGGLFQLMVATTLTAAGSRAMAGPVAADGDLPVRWGPSREAALLWALVNGGLGLAGAAAALGFAPSYVLNYPLPAAGPTLALWSSGALITGLTGIALLLAALVVIYPWLLARAIVGRPWGRTVPTLLANPGMLGMALAILVLPVAGLPLLVAAGTVYLGLLGIRLPTAALGEPFPFTLSFWIFAHNLMEAMGVMGLAAVYRLLPRITHRPEAGLAHPRRGALAILLVTAVAGPAFGHHLFTMVSSTPALLQGGAQAASWATGFAAAFTAFTIGATLWRGGFRPSPGSVLLVAGFALYLLDGFVALELSTPAWNLELHGTLYVTGHTMTILIALLFIGEGALILDRPEAADGWRRGLPYASIGVSLAGALAMFVAFLAGGAEGLVRRADPWGSGSSTVALVLLLSGLAFAAGQGGLLVAVWGHGGGSLGKRR